jgi:Family of unknown function (DUF6843)
MKRPFWLACGFVTLLLASSLIGADLKERLHPYQYVIPKGYVGWVRVDFNVKEAAPLSLQGNYYILRIPPSGHLQTSSDDGYGIAGDDYYYECIGKKQRLVISQGKNACMIWGNFQGPATLSDATPYKFRYFFVGLREEYQKYEFSGENQAHLQLENDGYPKVGSKVDLPSNE